jgi:hypothetical protein
MRSQHPSFLQALLVLYCGCCCCGAIDAPRAVRRRERSLPELEMHKNASGLPEVEVHSNEIVSPTSDVQYSTSIPTNATVTPAPDVQNSTSILSSMQTAQASFISKLVVKYGHQYTSTLFHDAFYELSDNGAAIQRRFLQRLVQQGNFTMGFTGISNTAGHDNLVREQSEYLSRNSSLSSMHSNFLLTNSGQAVAIAACS